MVLFNYWVLFTCQLPKKKLSLLSNQLKEQKFCKLLSRHSYFRPNTSPRSVRNCIMQCCMQIVFNVAVSLTRFMLCNFIEMILLSPLYMWLILTLPTYHVKYSFDPVPVNKSSVVKPERAALRLLAWSRPVRTQQHPGLPTSSLRFAAMCPDLGAGDTVPPASHRCASRGEGPHQTGLVHEHSPPWTRVLEGLESPCQVSQQHLCCKAGQSHFKDRVRSLKSHAKSVVEPTAAG